MRFLSGFSLSRPVYADQRPVVVTGLALALIVALASLALRQNGLGW